MTARLDMLQAMNVAPSVPRYPPLQIPLEQLVRLIRWECAQAMALFKGSK